MGKQTCSNSMTSIVRNKCKGAWQNAVSDQGLHSLPLIQQFSDTAKGGKMDLLKPYDKYSKA